MPTFQTLQNTPIAEILEALNLAFSDYIIPYSLTAEQFEEKLKAESIKLELSAGAFVNNKLVGLILHGFDVINGQNVIYNAGTGVIPAERGKHLIAQVYEFILPILHSRNINKIQLEAITTNERAIKTYKKLCFKITRELDCYKGEMPVKKIISDLEIRELTNYDREKLCSFWDIQPSWQHSLTTIENIKQNTLAIGIYKTEELLGYLIYNLKTKRIHQCAVNKNHRKKGIGRALFNYISTTYSPDAFVTNVEENSKSAALFLENMGLKKFITQYQMELTLK